MTFDFISDDKFRAGLTSDLRELESRHAAEAWKGVVILADAMRRQPGLAGPRPGDDALATAAHRARCHAAV